MWDVLRALSWAARTVQCTAWLRHPSTHDTSIGSACTRCMRLFFWHVFQHIFIFVPSYFEVEGAHGDCISYDNDGNNAKCA